MGNLQCTFYRFSFVDVTLQADVLFDAVHSTKNWRSRRCTLHAWRSALIVQRTETVPYILFPEILVRFFGKIRHPGARFQLLALAWRFEMIEKGSHPTRKWRIRAGIEPNATTSYATASVLSLGHYGFRGSASLQIENAQLKLHFSTCMLVLSFEWMNILQPTLCVILFHAFESSIIFERPSFYGLSGRPCTVDRFPKGHCFGWLSSNSSYRRKWRCTRLKLYSQSEERTLFRAVYELFWCGLWKQRNGGKYGCCNFFLKYFVKIGRLGKKFTHRLIQCSFIYKSMYYTSGFVEKIRR